MNNVTPDYITYKLYEQATHKWLAFLLLSLFKFVFRSYIYTPIIQYLSFFI